MKFLKIFGLAILTATAVTAFAGVGTASATTLEIKGVAQNKTVPFTASLKSGTSTTFTATNGTVFNKCSSSEFNGDTVKDGDGDFTGPVVGATLVEFYLLNCTNPVTIHKFGKLSFEWTKNTEGTVSSFEAEVTMTSGAVTLSCKTGAGVDVGTLTGVAAGNATLHIKAMLGCGFLAPSVKWDGTYEFTSPNGLGVIN